MNFLRNILIGLMLLFGASSIPAIPVQLDCPTSYQAPLYDTPSGDLEPGYYISSKPTSATTTYVKANIVGTKSFTHCYDTDGKLYVLPLTNDEYTNLRGKPNKQLTHSLIQEATQ